MTRGWAWHSRWGVRSISPLAHSNNVRSPLPPTPIDVRYYYIRHYNDRRKNWIWLSFDEKQPCRVLSLSFRVLRNFQYWFYVTCVPRASFVFVSFWCCLLLSLSISRHQRHYTIYMWLTCPFSRFNFLLKGEKTLNSIPGIVRWRAESPPFYNKSSRQTLQDWWMIDTTCLDWIKNELNRMLWVKAFAGTMELNLLKSKDSSCNGNGSDGAKNVKRSE